MRVLVFLRHFVPGYKFGGPVRTLVNTIGHLGDEVEFKVVTLDRDVGDTQAYQGVEVDGWNVIGQCSAFYVSPRNCSYGHLSRLMAETQHDLVYLNSFFDIRFSLTPLLARYRGRIPNVPFVVAPRGEFSPGALAIKRWKKMPFVYAAKQFGVYDDLVWHASTELEAEDIQRVVGDVARTVVIAPNLPPVQTLRANSMVETTTSSRMEDATKCLRIAFVSRITKKKGLDIALRVLQRVRVPVELSIYGPMWERGHWQQCETLIREMPENVTVIYHGGLEPERVVEVFRSYDLFFFPTRGENFGHVILEALSAGTPVLTSDQTPWDTAPGGGCTALPLKDEEGFVRIIEEFAQQTPTERTAVRKAAHEVAWRFVEQSQLVERTRQLFVDTAKGKRA